MSDDDDTGTDSSSSEHDTTTASAAGTNHGGGVDEPRRGALRTLVAAGGAVYAGALVVPALGYLNSTTANAAGGKERWMRVAPLNSIVDKKLTRVKITGDERDAFTISRNKTLGTVWVERDGTKVRALSAECPHLGCAIDLTGDGKGFACPCHTSRFALDGKSESGPSPRGMDQLSARVKNGWIEVDFRRFRQGVSERVEVA
ncbi:MAG TPA: Rieske (2Fe-2S) protein [Sorangium sp.]|nr:Rieske (2Fe-2S) protein [Sorangium sp.]